MAKRITTSKRDREKTKIQKREEKLKRKEERQSVAGATSLEEMFAYVDENGVLHSTPPPEKKKEEIDPTKIQVSVPKQADLPDDEPFTGKVDHFNSSKGYGFIKDTDSGEKYFFHISAAPAGIEEGDLITFEIERTPRGMNATNISIIK